MKAERPNIIFNIVTIAVIVWFLLKQLTILRRVEAELGVEFVNPIIAFICMAIMLAVMINSLIKDLRQLGNQGKTQRATNNN